MTKVSVMFSTLATDEKDPVERIAGHRLCQHSGQGDP